MIHDSHKDGAHGVPRVKKSASGVVVLPLPNEGNRRPLALAALGPTARAHRHHSRVAHAIWHVPRPERKRRSFSLKQDTNPAAPFVMGRDYSDGAVQSSSGQIPRFDT
eukprot:scaffold59855_cov24-Tisochrysis_lutea.AAC.1